MNILHVITSLYTGGAEKLMVDLLPRMKDEGLAVDLCIHDETDTPFKRDLEDKGIKVIGLGKGGSVYSPIKFFKLLPKLKNYDFIHTHNTASQLFVAAAKLFTHAKLITTEHNTTNRRRNKRWLKIFDKWMYNRYNTVICISKKAEDNLREYLPSMKPKILTINNGIDISKFSDAAPSEELEKIAPDSKKIIMVAAFREQKDHKTLIDSANLLPENFHIFLVGDGEKRKYYEEYVKEHNLEKRIHFLGLRSDIPSLLKSSDYVVLSSHYEGLSLSSVEGLTSGKPMIASDVEGLREVVEGGGVLFEHKNPEDLASKILELENNPSRYSLAAQSCTKKALEYDISMMVEGYLRIYSYID